MPPAAALVAIVTAILIGAISPGPSFVLVSRIALSRSRGHGLAAAIGMGIGGTVFASLALLGLIALLQQVAWLYAALKLGGGLYLLWLGLRIWRGAVLPLAADAPALAGPASLLRCVGFAALVQISNPKAAVVYAGIFAVLLPAKPPLWFLAALPPLVFLVEAGWYATVATLLSTPGSRRAYLGARQWLDRVAGGVLGLLGLRLAWEALARKT